MDRITELPLFISLDVGGDFLLQWGLIVIVFGVAVGAIGSAISLTVHRYIRT